MIMTTRQRLLTLTCLLVLGVRHSRAADNDVQFNTDVLDVKDRQRIDLKQFSRAGYLMPGDYQLAIRIGKTELPEQTITFMAPADDPNGSQACLTKEIVPALGLKDSAARDLKWWHDGQCLDTNALPGMTTHPDLGTGTLYLDVPQAYLEYTAENWDPPARWDDGVPGLLFDYGINAMNTRQSTGEQTQSVSGNGTAGANAGPWRLRADWQSQYNRRPGQNSSQSWDWNRYYAYRAVKSMRAKLSLGENYLDSAMFDSFQFMGVSLVTDDRQLPANLRGYAPEVVGVAKTNAKVTVSQQGRVLEETTVAAGPFRIQNLDDAVSGKLDVTVQEQDGTVQTFQVNTASIPYLTRPGVVRYKASAGKPSGYDHKSQGPEFATGEFSWGINNGWSLYGGGLFTGDYDSLAVGVGRDLMAFGALSFDVTHSRAILPVRGDTQGDSYRLSYSKRFEEYDSQVTFAGYRFSERNFMTLSQYLTARTNGGVIGGNSKEMYTISLNKQFRDLNLNAYLNYGHQTYWGGGESDNWNASLSNTFDLGRFKSISLSLSANRTQSEGRNDDGVYLGLSLPWGGGGSMSYSGQYAAGTTSNRATFSRQIDSNNSYNVSAGTSSDSSVTGSGYFDHEGDIARVSANASFSGSDYSAVGVSVQGGVTATAEGAALHRSGVAGGTRMMVDTAGVANVPVLGSGAITNSNMFGKAVVADIGSYYRSSVDVDLDRLPDNVDATRSVVQDTLTEGAIGYRKFGILAGLKAMAVIKMADGSSPPFGSTVTNESQLQTGIVGDEGNVWLTGMKPGGVMDVNWDGKAQCQIHLPEPLPPDLSRILLLPCTDAATAPADNLAKNRVDQPQDDKSITD
ncbi:outer membrane usher protein [Erwinia billingiae]|uniref:outer membrane usher protein n=1 Tax=Erwinia billingiae TaxID=182337 RepID=UPI0012472833|nr:outer membrane usher protein [Erwinia billingiae]